MRIGVICVSTGGWNNYGPTFIPIRFETKEPKGLFPLRLRVALRGVAWRALVTSAMKRVEAR